MKSQQNATTDSPNHQLPTLDTNDLTEQQKIAYIRLFQTIIHHTVKATCQTLYSC